ncbi:unnamed protein product [Mortierella alpina]
MFGFCDAAFAVYCFWLMGALSNKHDELSRYAGFFKSIQSLGSAVAAPLDLAQTPLLAYLITNWILCAISIATMFLVTRTISDTTIDDEDEDGYEEDYEYDDQELEAGEPSSCGTSDVHDQNETRPQDQGVREQSNSFEGDMSTICATSDVGTAALDARSSGRPSAHWRNSSKASGHQDDYQDPGAQHSRSSDNRGNRLAAGDQSPAATHLSASDETTFPSRTYQQHHQQPLDRNAYLLAGMPAMTEVQHRPMSGVGSAYWADQPLSRAGSSHSSFFPQFQTSIPNSSASAPAPSSSSAGTTTQYLTPMYMQGFSPSTQPPPPSLVISDDSSLPVPLFTYPPAHLYLHPPWAEESSVHGAPEPEGRGEAEGGHNPAAIGYLMPHEPLDEALRRASSGSSTRYDDDQDMDSIDTHSISSMSSGHDSIPEMTEMTDIPRPRDT